MRLGHLPVVQRGREPRERRREGAGGLDRPAAEYREVRRAKEISFSTATSDRCAWVLAEPAIATTVRCRNDTTRAVTRSVACRYRTFPCADNEPGSIDASSIRSASCTDRPANPSSRSSSPIIGESHGAKYLGQPGVDRTVLAAVEAGKDAGVHSRSRRPAPPARTRAPAPRASRRPAGPRTRGPGVVGPGPRVERGSSAMTPFSYWCTNPVKASQTHFACSAMLVG